MTVALANAQMSVPGWQWNLPAMRYQRLNLSQRASVDRGNDLFTRGENAMRQSDWERRHGNETRRAAQDRDAIASFRASATEWRRFGMEFVNAPEYIMGYTQFMQGLSLYGARDRYAAVRILTEVIDLYEEIPDIVVPALFWRGRAFADSGDTVKATTDWQMIVDTPEYMAHPLYFTAMLDLARQEWNRMRFDAAASRWERLIAMDEEKVPRDVLDDARTQLIIWYGFQDTWDRVTPLVEAMARGNANRQIELNWHFLNHFWHFLGHDWRTSYFDKVYRKPEDAERAIAKVRLGIVNWFEKQAEVYVPFGDVRVWEHALQVFRYRRWIDNKRGPELAMALAKRMREDEGLDVATRQRRAGELIDALTQAEMFIEARSVLEQVTSPVQRLWNLYTIEHRANNRDEAVRVLIQLTQNSDFDTARHAKRTLAEYYRHYTNQQEEAIKLYTELADPPWTLWCIANSYERMRAWDRAQNVLSEIASIFPNDAARAMFEKGRLFEAAGNREQAIGAFRRILQHPEWKRASEASQAHQTLRSWGIDPGGGEIHEIH